MVAADLRGYGAAATIQGLRVFVATFSAPSRARMLDRVGRHRVIVPQTLLFAAMVLLFGAAVSIKSVALSLVLLATIVPAAVSPSTDSDQGAVHRLVIKLESLRLEVVEFRRLPGETADPRAAPPSP